MQRNLGAKLCAAAVAGLTIAGAQAAVSDLQLVIKNTDAVPGIAGVNWLASGAFPTTGSTIDESGNVGTRGGLLIGGAVTSSNNQVMLYGAPGSMNLVARTGVQAPGLPGGNNVTSFQTNTLPLSANGNLWFGGNTTAPSGYIATGLYNGLGKVARRGDTLPGSAGTLTDAVNSASNYSNVNNAGQTLVFSGLSSGGGGLWVGNSAAQQLVYQTGGSYTGLPSTLKNTVGQFVHNGAGNVVSDIVVNSNGFTVTDLNNEALVRKQYGGTSFSILAREGAVAPGTGGANYVSAAEVIDPFFGNYDPSTFYCGLGNFNNSDHTIYGATLTGTGVTAGVNDSAVFFNNGAASQVFRRKGDATTAVAGATVAVDASGATGIRLNNADKAAWAPALTTGVAGVTSANDRVLLQTDATTGVDTLIAREGSNVPVVPGALFGTSFSSLMQNNAGQIVFSTTLLDDPADTNNNVVASNNSALFAWDPTYGLSLVARTGDNLSPIGINMTLTSINVFSTPNAEGGMNALSDNGWLTFRVAGTALPGFTDNAAIVRTMIPEPASMSLLGVSIGLLVRRRRA